MIYCLDTDIIIEYFRGNEAIKNKIASIVKEHGAVLITNNEDHFKRIDGLKIENWLKI